MSEFLTLEQAAERLGVDYKTVYRLVRSGELPAGKIGRIYRIRAEDLDAFFERQKRGTAAQARRLAPVEGNRCAACGRPMLSELSTGGQCEECEREICQACWAIKKVRRCGEHEQAEAQPGTAGSGVARQWPTAPERRSSRQQAERERAIEELRKAGKPVVTADELPLAAENFLRAFAQRIGRMEELRDPLSGLTVRLRKARVKHALEGVESAVPAEARSRFTLRFGGWGRPKGCIVLEARLVARGQRLKSQGYDAEPVGKAELSGVLNELAAEAARGDCFRVVLLASPTGWAAPAAKMLTRPDAASSFHDRKVAVVLWDLSADSVVLDEEDERLWPFWPIVAPGRYGRAVEACREAVREALVTQNSISAQEAARRTGADVSWARDAFEQLRREGGYVVDNLPDTGMVISRGA